MFSTQIIYEAVIPALRPAQDKLAIGQAGIQQKLKFSEADKTTMLSRYRGSFFNQLDSRRRGNDAIRPNGTSGLS